MVKRVKGLRATRIYRSIMVDLYWSRDYNIPLFSRRSYGNVYKVRLVPPGDVRPAYSHDIDALEKAIECDLGSIVREFCPRDQVVLLNKIQGVDAADEVVVGGYSIGFRFYDIFSRRWRFRPMYYGVSYIVHNKIGPYIVVREDKLRDYMFISLCGACIVSKNLYGEWVSIETSNGKYQGVGKIVGDKIRVIKSWKSLPVPSFPNKPSTLDDIVKRNTGFLEAIEEEAIGFLKSYIGSGYRLVATISGGKDSSVALAIAVEAGVDKAIFSDTGIEHPETIETIERLVDRLGVELDIVCSDGVFWDKLGLYGPPARDYRWCTTVVKLVYLNKYFSEKGWSGVVASVTGQRRYESTQRALAGRVSRAGTGSPYSLLLSPVYNWISLYIHTYIHWRRLPLHPLYTYGFDRIGCFLCPTSRLSELSIVEKLHPELWSKWSTWLEQYRRRHGLPVEWISLGLWRWRYDYPPEIKRFLASRGYRVRELIEKQFVRRASVEPWIEYNGLYYKTIRLLDIVEASTEKIASVLRLLHLDSISVDREKIIARTRGVEAVIYRSGVIELKTTSKRRAIEILDKVTRAVYMAGKCSLCGLCSYVAPGRSVRPGPRVSHCPPKDASKILYVCPVATYLSRDSMYMARRY